MMVNLLGLRARMKLLIKMAKSKNWSKVLAWVRSYSARRPCWGKLLFKVMRYILRNSLKKQLIMLLSYFLWKVMR